MSTSITRAPSLPPLTPVAAERRTRLTEWLGASPYEAVLLSGAENVQYATGYRSSPGSHRRAQRLVAIVTTDRTVLVGPRAELPAATVPGTEVDEYVSYGAFAFEGARPPGPSSHADLPAALAAALPRWASGARLGVDAPDWGPAARAIVESAAASVDDVSFDLQRVRSVKLPGEVQRLRHAARLTEDAIAAAVDCITAGVTERELAAVVAGVMSAGGAVPRFLVVTAGERTAYSDVFPSDAPVAPGDLVRFDVGCTVDGYSSDIGRMAVLGEADAWQRDHYAAILAGELAQIAAARPGMTADALFRVAVDAVEAAGLRPYRRHHCGHGIGLDTYEAFSVAPGSGHELEQGNVLCVETPYYALGRGGMLVEDALLITATGCEALTISDRSLREVAP